MSGCATPAARASQPGFGLFSLSCLVIANMIGAGVYTSSGFALADLGSRDLVLLAWGIAGGIAMLGAMCYGGLARQLTESGGEYLFLSRAVHPLAGFMAGWISLTAGFSGAIAYAAITFEAYLPAGSWIAELPPPVVPSVLIGLFGALHFARLSAGAGTQNVLVLVKMVLLAVFVAIGLVTFLREGTHSGNALESGAVEVVGGTGSPTSIAVVPISLAALATSVMWCSFSYAGYNAAVYVAGTSSGGSAVARSMWIATAVVTGLYLALNGVILWSTPAESLVGQKDVLKIAAESIGGAGLRQFVTGVILLSLATSVSAMVLAGPHVYSQMARDGVLPRWLAAAPDGLPRRAIVLQCLLAVLLTIATNLQQLLDYLAFLLMLSSAGSVFCLLLPRFAGRPGKRPVIAWPVTPVLFVGASLGIAALALSHRLQEDPRGLVMAALVLPLGLVLYPVFSRGRRPLV